MKRPIRIYKSALIVLVLLFITLSAQSQGLSGTYIVGSAPSSYGTIQAAADDLVSKGLNGNVNFVIKTGVYTEHVKIDSFSHNNYSVVFRSWTNNSSDVLITHEPQTTGNQDNYTLYLDGADNITFKNLSFESTKRVAVSWEAGRVILIVSNSDNISFENCELESYVPNTGSEIANSIIHCGSTFGSSAENDNISVTNCKFTGGYAGYSQYGPYSGSRKSQNVYLKDNRFENQKVMAISINYHEGIKVFNNVVENYLPPNNFRAISIVEPYDSILVDGNYVKIKERGMTLYLTNFTGANTSYSLISNNQLILLDSSVSGNQSHGILASQCDSIIFEHNSINQLSKDSTATGIYLFNGSKAIALNNIIHCPNGAIARRNYYGANAYLQSDYNVFFSKTAPIYKDEVLLTRYTSLAQIQSNLNQDSNSLFLDVLYNNDSLLIPNAVLVYDSGVYTGRVLKDFYGTTRSTTPDIGCYEGSLKFNEVELTSIQLNKEMLCSDDSINISIDVANKGLDTLNSFNISLVIDSTNYTIADWNGTLIPDASLSNISLVTIAIPSNEKMNIVVNLSNPNNETDDDSTNNSLTRVEPIGLGGTYTLGTDTSDFKDFTSAFERLHVAGICKEVTFIVEDSIYTEKLSLKHIKGVSEKNTITFEGRSKDSSTTIIEFDNLNSSDDYVLRLNGASHVSFKYIGFQSSPNHFESLVEIDGKCENISFYRCGFQGEFVGHKDNYLINIKSNDTITSLFIDYCYFSESRFQLFNQNGSALSNIRIRGCNFYDPVFSSVVIHNIRKLLLDGNTFKGKGQSILSVSNARDSVVVKNNLFNSNNTMNATMNIENCSGTTQNPLLIKNNMIINKNYSNKASVALIENDSVLFINNSVLQTFGSTGVLRYKSSKYGQIENNIIVSSPHNATVFQILKPDVGSAQIPSSNANLYHAPASNSLHYLGSNYELTLWQSQLKIDEESFFEPIKFKNDSTLFVDSISSSDGNAFLNTWVTKDFSGVLRDSLAPDIGADEFTIDSIWYIDFRPNIIFVPSTNCNRYDSLVFRIVNHDTVQIDSFDLSVKVFDNLIFGKKVYTTIASNDSIEITIPNFNMYSNTTYHITTDITYFDKVNIRYKQKEQLFKYWHLNAFNILVTQRNLCEDEVILTLPFSEPVYPIWQNGSTETNITVLNNGVHSVEVKDERGCTIQGQINLN